MLLTWLLCALLGGPITPLPNAHAHNDYAHARPLLDALDHSFCSVEADIFCDGDALHVAHDRKAIKPERTLEALYLDPLLERVRANGGRVYPGGPSVTLLIDIKENGAETYARLRDVLAHYREMLTVVRDGVRTEGAVTVVLSGDCPREMVLADRVRCVGIDGQVADLDSKLPAHAMPLISDRWGSHFRWNGAGQMPDAERARLRDIVARAHAAGRRVRFWGAPQNEAFWSQLRESGVDLLNTDYLQRLQDFLLGTRIPPPTETTQRTAPPAVLLATRS